MEKETPKRLAPKTDTLRALFAKSGNECAFPYCDHPLIDEEENFIAQVCHIEDALPGGRFNENSTNEKRRSYSNLMLFCYRHHVETNNVEKFPVERLREIKESHESRFTTNFVVREAVLINIFNALKSIKDDTTEIRKTQQSHTEYFEEIKAILSTNKLEAKEVQESNYVKEIETILKLRDSNNHRAALRMFEEFKAEKWDKLNGTERYKLIANIGICELELHDQEKAANYFIEAFQYDPENDRAVGFAALGYSIKGDSIRAKASIEEAIKKNPKNTNAYVALILLERDSLSFSEIVSQIPKDLHDNPEVSFAIGGLAGHKGDHDTAINWLQNAVDVAEKNKADFKVALASTIFESVINPYQFVTGQIDVQSRNRITYCIELLSESWEEFKDSDLRKARAWVLVNRGIAKKFIGDFDGAFEDINQANNISEESYFTTKHLAIIAFETNKLDLSLQLLDRLSSLKPDNEKDGVDVNLFKAEVQYKKKDFVNSIENLKLVIENPSSQKVKEEAQSTLIFAYLGVDANEDAKNLCLSIVKDNPNYLRGYIDASRVHFTLNENDDALKLLESAYNKLSEEANHLDIQELAIQLLKHEDYSKAINLLERITDPEIYTDLSRTLLSAYYQAGQTGKALELSQSIRSGHGPIDVIAEMQSSIYESIGDLSNAIEVCEEYLKVYPDDQRIQIRLAIVYSRIKDEIKVKEILDGLEVLGDLPIEVVYQLAYLNVAVGEWQRGLDFAFEVRRKNANYGNAHLKYIGLLSEFRSLTDQVGEKSKVEIDTAVKVRNEKGELLAYYILDDSEKYSREELLINDPLAESIIGAAVGDTVEVSSGLGEPQKFEVIAILNKYVYAFQESIDLLSNKFVGVEGFRVFNSGSTGDIKKDLKPIFDALDQSEEYDNQVYSYYKQRSLTIGACAQLKGQNPIKFWSIVFSDPELGIYSIGQSHHEFQIAEILIDRNSGIVIDLVSLLTLASIGQLELLEGLSNKKVVSRSLVENIDDLLREFKGMGSEGYLSVGKFKGEYVRDHVTKDRIDSNIDHYETLQKWISEYCEVLPCTQALLLNATEKEQYDKTLGEVFIDSILIAKEHNYLLLADEENLRAMAFNDFQVKGFPSFVLLNHALKNHKIEFEAYNTEIATLLRHGYQQLPLNSEVLFKCADLSNYQPNHPFDLALKTLEFPNSTDESSVYVAAEFIYKLYSSITVPQVRLNLMLPLLNALVHRRNFTTVIQRLMVLIEMKFRVLQKQKDEVQSTIRDFARTYRQ